MAGNQVGRTNGYDKCESMTSMTSVPLKYIDAHESVNLICFLNYLIDVLYAICVSYLMLRPQKCMRASAVSSGIYLFIYLFL